MASPIDNLDLSFFVSAYHHKDLFETCFITRTMIDPKFHPIWDFIMDHKAKYKTYPDVKTIQNITGLNIDFKVPETREYWEDHIFNRFAYEKTYLEIGELVKLIAARKTSDALKRMRSFCEEMDTLKKVDSIIIESLLDSAAIKIQVAKARAGITGIPTPYPSLTERTNGWQPEELIVLAARMGVGKTTALLQFLLHPFSLGKKVLIVSTEMSAIALQMRSSAFVTKASYKNLRSGNISDLELDLITKDLDLIANSSNAMLMRNVNSMHTTIESIDYAIGRMKPDIIGIDGAYLLHSENAKAKDRFNKIAEIFDMIKGLGKKHQIPIIITTQLNRETFGKSKKIDMSRLAFSDNIGMIADWVFFLSKNEDNDAEMIIQMGKMREADNWDDITVNWDFKNHNFTEKGVVQNSAVNNPFNPASKAFIDYSGDECPEDSDDV